MNINLVALPAFPFMAAMLQRLSLMLAIMVFMSTLISCKTPTSSKLSSPESANIQEVPSQRPNLLLVVTDDQRYDAMGIVQSEQMHQGKIARVPWLATPTMDALARTGIRFRQGFVTLSLCSPSRSALLTGRYNHANGVVHNSQPYPAALKNFGSILGMKGYRTGYFGKWHHGEQRTRPGFSTVRSYEGHGVYMGQLTRPKTPGDDERYPFSEEGERLQPKLIFDGQDVLKKGYIDDLIADEVASFIKQNKTQPWVAMVGFKTPHQIPGNQPYGMRAVPPKRTIGCYAKDTLSGGAPGSGLTESLNSFAPWNREKTRRPYSDSVMRAYYQSISGVDGSLRQILKALNDSGQAKHTVVIFTSDNGYFNGEHNLVDKRSAYEESMRVPFIFNYPALMGHERFEIPEEAFRCDGKAKSPMVSHQQPAGLTSDELVLNIDVAPTFLEFAGLGSAQINAEKIHGKSLKNLVTNIVKNPNITKKDGEKSTLRDSFLFAYHYDPEYMWPQSGLPQTVAVRNGRYKLVVYPQESSWDQLFDLEKDPYELVNRVKDAKYAEVLSAMKSDMARRKAEVGFCFLTPNQDRCPIAPRN